MSSAQTPRLPPVLAEYPQGVRIRGPERHQFTRRHSHSACLDEAAEDG